MPLLPNGIRTLNPWHQFIVDATILNIINKYGIPHLVPPSKLTISEVVDYITDEVSKL
jgi:hypothetical protein